MARKSKSSRNAQSPVTARQVMPYLLRGLAIGAWLIVAAALLSHDPADWPGVRVLPHHQQPHNWIGRFGAVIAHQAYLMLGPGVWVAMTGWAVLTIAYLARRAVSQLVLRVIGIVIMTFTASGLIGVTLADDAGLGGLRAGLVASWMNDQLLTRFNFLGAWLILATLFWVGAVLAADQIVVTLVRWAGLGVGKLREVSVPKPVLVGTLGGLSAINPLRWFRRGPALGAAGARGGGGAAAAIIGSDGHTLRLPPRIKPKGRGDRVLEDGIDEDAGGLGATESFDPDKATIQRGPSSPGAAGLTAPAGVTAAALAAPTPTASDADLTAELDDNPDDPVPHNAPAAYIAEKQDDFDPRKFDPDELRAKIKRLPINFAKPGGGKGVASPSGTGGTPGVGVHQSSLEGYRFPGMDLLLEPETNFNAEMEKIVRDQAVLLEEALRQYKIDGEVVGIDSGPVITLYEVRLAPGTKVSVLSAVASDLARALKAQNIRIVPNMVGKDTVGVEVPNLKKEKVRLKELMTNPLATSGKMGLPMFLGKDASGNPLIADLTTMPHMLIAGTTGSGKSVCMNSIIMSFLFTKRPDELKLVLVDPKMVEMSMFKDVPHLMCPVVTEMSKAAAILEWATTKMDERYELLAEAAVRDIAGYNALSWDELKERFSPATEAEEARIPRKLPYLVFVIDELADLMITNKEVEGFIVRVAQKARAVGIHLILATQRPQANVVTGLIKANMPCRVSFKVASGMDSRIVLDQKGAELLLGQGDMLYLSPRTSKLTRAQGTLVDDAEIRGTVKFLKEVAQQNFEPQLIQLRSPEQGDVDEEAARDPLFEEAVQVVLETKRGSVSLLQRRLTVGYSRASRLIEAMAASGILGEYKGSQAREVAISIEEWEAMKEQMRADAAAAEKQGKGTLFDPSHRDTAQTSSDDTAVAEAFNPDSDDESSPDDDDSVPDELENEYRQ